MTAGSCCEKIAPTSRPARMSAMWRISTTKPAASIRAFRSSSRSGFVLTTATTGKRPTGNLHVHGQDYGGRQERRAAVLILSVPGDRARREPNPDEAGAAFAPAQTLQARRTS